MLLLVLFSISAAEDIARSALNGYAPPVREVLNNAFDVGELLEFSINWGYMNVGKASMAIKQIAVKNSRPCYEIEAAARSNRVLSSIYRVNDLFISFLDTSAIMPQEYFKYQNEGNYHFDQQTYFDHPGRKAKTRGRRTIMRNISIKDSTLVIPEEVYDVISAFYYTRLKKLK
ncbi:MAG: DUF3108 domain-containing protein, partial [bacterium]